MLKKIASILVVLIFLSCSFSIALAFSTNKISDKENNIQNDTKEIINGIHSDDISNYLELITSRYIGRKTGTEKCRDTSKFIYNELNKFGDNLDVSYQEFDGLGKKFVYKPFGHWVYRRLTSRNVIAEIPGKLKDCDTYILSAHYDVGNENSPGALDNGAGVAALLTIAKNIKKFQFNNTIKIVFFSGEELFFMGSYAFAKKAYESGENIAGVINADVIANNTYNRANHNLIRAYGNDQSQDIIEIMQNVSKNNIGLEVKKESAYCGHSDDKAFDDYGYGALQLFQSAFNMEDFYGQKNDDLSLINISYLTNVTKLLGGTIAEIGNIINPEFEMINPKEDRSYSKNSVKDISYPTIDGHLSGDTFVKSKNIVIKVKASDCFKKVNFELLCGDNEKGNKISDKDENDDKHKEVIKSKEVNERNNGFFEWKIENKYLNWYTIKATGYDYEGNEYTDHIEIKFYSIKGFSKNILYENIFSFILGLIKGNLHKYGF